MFALLTTAPAEARADRCDNPLSGACINSDTLWASPGPGRFLGIGGGETVGQGQVGFGLLASYASRPVLLRVASPGPSGTPQSAVDDQVNASFLFAYGVTDRLQLDLAAPVTLAQNGTGTSALSGGATLRSTALRDLRFGLAYSLVPRLRIDPEKASTGTGRGRTTSVVARFTTSAPTGDRDAFAGERSAVFVPSVAGDVRFGKVFVGADLGARIRPVGEFAGARIGTQLTTALGAGYDLLAGERLSVFLEGRALWTFAEQFDTQQSAYGVTSSPNGRTITPAEWTLGVRSAPFPGGDVAFTAGGGGPVPGFGDAATTPRFRFLLGIVYAPTMRDTDGDGVPDRVDACPDVKGVRSGERPGCPPAPAPSP
jgi:OOP family OmpA-OmpF porin